ncbi:BC85_0335 family putative methyltransferase [Mycoplasmopsis primatum]|uniref:BC85_0335 family putative methyltransferase n=1 Tax=Mycoplasmopsis primatum TaxID=55604 RepID=UPI000494DBA0|nr:hypothetical protein [Mycoplasmopsis primatum]
MSFKEKLVIDNHPTALGWGLIASVIVLTIISVIVSIVIFVKIRKIKKEIDADYNKKANDAILAIKGSPLETKPDYINQAFKTNIDELDEIHIVKSVYLNYVKDVLLTGYNLENLYLTLKELTLANIHIESKAINNQLWNDAVLDLPDKIKEKPNFVQDDDLQYRLIVSVNEKATNDEIFQKFYPKLTTGGMLMVVQNADTKKDLKSIKTDLKIKKIRFEASKNKALFLYIVKS